MRNRAFHIREQLLPVHLLVAPINVLMVFALRFNQSEHNFLSQGRLKPLSDDLKKNQYSSPPKKTFNSSDNKMDLIAAQPYSGDNLLQMCNRFIKPRSRHFQHPLSALFTSGYTFSITLAISNIGTGNQSRALFITLPVLPHPQHMQRIGAIVMVGFREMAQLAVKVFFWSGLAE